MKINILLPHFGLKPGGGFRIVYQYADLLSARGHEMCLIYPASVKNGFGAVPGYLRTVRDICQGGNWYTFQNSVNQKYVLSLQEKNIPDADICIATAYETSRFLNCYSLQKGRKIYFIQDFEAWAASQEEVESTWKYDMKKIVISRHLMDLGGQLQVKNMELLPNPIDLGLFRLKKPMDQRKMIIGMLYSKAERKGSCYGIKALCHIKKRYPEVHAILFGTAKRPEGLPNWMEYYQRPEQEFLVNEIYNKISIFVCSSLYEGWGLPGMEAMACGAAVLTTDCGGVENYAIHEKTALVCEPGNAEALAAGIERFIMQPELRLEIARQGFAKVKEFSMDCAVDKLERILMQEYHHSEIGSCAN